MRRRQQIPNDRAGPTGAEDLAAAMTAIGGAVGSEGRWCPPPGVAVHARYRAIARSAAGRDLAHQQMITILIVAGYSSSSAAGG